MKLDAYRKARHPLANGGEEYLFLLVQYAVVHVRAPLGWSAAGDHEVVAAMMHIRSDVLNNFDAEVLRKFSGQLFRAGYFLSTGNPVYGIVPTGDDIRRSFSTAYHMLNPSNNIGAADRTAFEKALHVLNVGDILPDPFVSQGNRPTEHPEIWFAHL